MRMIYVVLQKSVWKNLIAFLLFQKYIYGFNGYSKHFEVVLLIRVHP